MRRVDAAYALILDESNEKVLLVKNWRRGGTVDFTLPGGAVEEDETLTEATVREVKEETGYDIEVENLATISEVFFEDHNNHIIFFTFYGKVVGGEITINYPEEIADVQWVEIKKANELLQDIELNVSELIDKKSSALYQCRGMIEMKQ